MTRMLTRRFVFLASIALPLAAQVQAQAQTETPAPAEPWQTIVGPDLRFRLEMPAPVTKTSSGEKEKGHASERIAWNSKYDGEMFDFDFVDYQPGWFSDKDTKVMARELGRGDAEKAFPRDRFKYIRDEPITLQGWDGYALDIEDAEGSAVLMRTYIVKDRLYRFLVTAKADDKTRTAAKRFLDSLRLADTRS